MNSDAFVAGFDDGLDKLAKGGFKKYFGKAKKGLGKVERLVSGAKTQDVPSKDLLRKALRGKDSKSIQMVEKGRMKGKGPKEYEEMGRGRAAAALAGRYGVPAAAGGAGALGLGALLKGKKKD